nr:MAG TPA: integrase [Caudoviricetes sp.]
MSPFVERCAGGSKTTASRLIDYLKSFMRFS